MQKNSIYINWKAESIYGIFYRTPIQLLAFHMNALSTFLKERWELPFLNMNSRLLEKMALL